jgi:hypothetical protein
MNYCKILSNLNSCKLIFKGSFHGWEHGYVHLS